MIGTILNWFLMDPLSFLKYFTVPGVNMPFPSIPSSFQVSWFVPSHVLIDTLLLKQSMALVDEFGDVFDAYFIVWLFYLSLFFFFFP